MPIDGITRVKRRERLRQVAYVDVKVPGGRSLLNRIIWSFVIVLSVTGLVFVIANIPALIYRVGYSVGNADRPVVNQPYKIDSSIKKQLPKSATSNPNNTTPTASVENNRMYIEKINLSVPILWQVKAPDFNRQLQNGVINIATTGLPGQKGNMFITGHSSDFWWSKGNYRTVFALLGKMQKGDLIHIAYENRYFTYRVYNLATVNPEQAPQYALPKQDKPETLTLMTCTPLGTNINRLMVQAERIF